MIKEDTLPANVSEPKTSLSVFFPCYNEQDNVNRTVEQALAVLSGLNADFEIIIVDDGSSDATGQIADQISRRDSRVKVVHHHPNLGYGAALQSGFKAAAKKYVFYADGDGQFDISELPPLLPLMSQFDIVSCYRLNRQDNFVRRFNGWAWTKLVCFLLNIKIRDIDCAFKLYKREIFDNIQMSSMGALINAEILARATRKGYSITQKGVHHYPRTAGTQTGANLRVILRAFKELIKLRSKIISGS
ncbi:MAG: glycosyltransferase family 2 protein [Phycisphaerae bacterium]|nr:glycosyltransferase family 2 protein [Phycisphaerae bacterium]MDD5381651.1 glycosyltransferase family 2 protein [Phycisphaerae bacterium]